MGSVYLFLYMSCLGFGFFCCISYSHVLLSAYTYCHDRTLSALLALVSFGQITCPNTPLGWTRSVISALGPQV